MPNAQDFLIRQLSTDLARLREVARAREVQIERLRLENEKAAEKARALEQTLNFYKEQTPAELFSASGDGAAEPEASGASPDEPHYSLTVTEAGDKILPPGYIRTEIFRFIREKGRFVHSGEVQEAIREDVINRFGDEDLVPHRFSVSRNLKTQWEKGKIARVVYGNGLHNYYHGLTEWVVGESEERRYVSPIYAPPAEQLGDAATLEPEFPEHD
ncbi:hypothetical protein [Rubrivirga sp.]|uniref:hypothetical protein n=1 Tax=Rubrivirga sp. TaxID=1885344 RepID=UPI003B5197E3